MLFYTLFAFFLGMAVLGTVSRSILIMVPVTLIYLVGFGPGGARNRLPNLFLLAGLVFVFFNWVLVYNSTWNHRYNQLINRTLTPEEARYSQIQIGEKVIQERFFTGYGLGQAEDIYKVANQAGIEASGAHSSHNTFLSMFVDVGLVGFLMILAFWAHLFYGAFKVYFARTGSDYLNALTRLLPLMMFGLVWWWNVGDGIRHNFSWTIIGFFWAVIWLVQHDAELEDAAPPQHATA